MKRPILVVLAAGMGSRYGGLKQMDAVGANAEVLLDYSAYDAIKSGFEKIVFIIRSDIEKDFMETVLARMSGIKYDIAFQNPDSLIPRDIFQSAQKAGRSKPWGTAHALLCAADKIDAPFTVINADDFYGRDAYGSICRHLTGNSGESAIVPYVLEKTLSSTGTVARGVCEVKNGFLCGVEELTAIEKKDGRVINTAPDGSIRELAPDTPVSMNFWGFYPSILKEFEKYFNDFLATFAADIPANIKAECYIPKAADYFIKTGVIRIKALETCSSWFGVTYKEDREDAINRIKKLTANGVYPQSLW